MGLYLNGSPPKREPRPRLHRLVEPGQRRLICTSSGFHLERVHFYNRKRWQHSEGPAECVPCHAGRRLVCYGFLACWLEQAQEYGVFEVTQRAMENFVRYCNENGIESLFGRTITVHRGKGGRTARQWIDTQVSMPPTSFNVPPPTIDIGGLLSFLYMEQGRLDFEKPVT